MGLLTGRFELVTGGFELVTRRFELITRGFELATRGFELVTRVFELVTRGCEFVTRNSCLTFPLSEALVFQNASKLLLIFSLSNRAIFFSENFPLKNLLKKHTFILTSMMTENSVMAFHHVFMITFYAFTLQKLFSTEKT